MSNNPFEEINNKLSELQKEIAETKAMIQTSPNSQGGKFLRGDQALANELNVCLSTIRKWRGKGTIPSTQHGRIVLYDLSLVHEALKNHRHGRKN